MREAVSTYQIHFRFQKNKIHIDLLLPPFIFTVFPLCERHIIRWIAHFYQTCIL